MKHEHGDLRHPTVASAYIGALWRIERDEGAPRRPTAREVLALIVGPSPACWLCVARVVLILPGLHRAHGV